MLHLGCAGMRLPPPFAPENCREVRLDIDPDAEPDILADMAHLPEGIGPFAVTFSSHSLEHLYPYDVEKCLSGVYRVLAPQGKAVFIVPDLEGLSPTEDIVFIAESGHEIRAVDMFYGFRPALERHPYMAHHTGFVAATLKSALERAGFANVRVERGVAGFNLFGVGTKP